MTSSRLPGKVLLPAGGRPLLELMVERLRRASRIDAIVIATTDDPSSEPLEELAQRLGIGCFRGSEDDVLARVLGAAQAYDAELIVELTGDCPLIDPELVDRCIERFARGDLDYVSNDLEPTYPLGMSCRSSRRRCWRRWPSSPKTRRTASTSRSTSTSTPSATGSRNVASGHPERADLRLTVDTREDYELVRTVFETLEPEDPAFGLDADRSSCFAARPELRAINQHVEQRSAR